MSPEVSMLILGLSFGRLVYPHIICFEPLCYISCYLDVTGNHLYEFIKYVLFFWHL